MKKFFLIVIYLFILASCLFANENNPDPDSTERDLQFMEFMFGILPNPYGEINNLAYIKLNYTENLSSSLMIYLREYAEVESKTEDDGDDIENINSNKRRDAKLNAITYRLSLLKKDSVNSSLSPELNINYYDEEKIKEMNSTWDSDTDPGTKDLYFQRTRINSRSLMPLIDAVFEVSFFEKLSLYLGGGYIPVSFDYNSYDEFGSSTEEDPVLQREAYYEAKYNVNYTSMGFTAKGGLSLKKIFFGEIAVDFSWLYKYGDSKVKDRWWDYDLEENIIEEYNVVDKRSIISLDIYYYMTFLEFRGIIPILKFGMLRQTVMFDDEKEPL